jgi:hypothetical protein
VTLAWYFGWLILVLWLPSVASVVLFVHCWRSGLLRRPGVVGSWCAAGITLVGVSVALSPRIPGAYFGVPPVSVLAGPLAPVWVAGQLVCVGVAIYLCLKAGIR